MTSRTAIGLRKVLSRLGSVIGPPLCADALTSQLEVLPFAKMCMQYKVGDPLPNVIEVVDLDPITEQKNIVEVKVTYLNKPMICSHCKSLGHLVGACPATTRVWVQKNVTKPATNLPPDAVDNDKHVEQAEQELGKGMQKDSSVEAPAAQGDPLVGNDQHKEEQEKMEWTEVRTKRKPIASPSSSMGSPSPSAASKSQDTTRLLDTTRLQDRGISKSARRRAKKAALGSLSPFT